MSSQDLNHFTEKDTFHFDDNAHTVNPKDVNAVISQMKIDSNAV